MIPRFLPGRQYGEAAAVVRPLFGSPMRVRWDYPLGIRMPAARFAAGEVEAAPVR